MKLTSILLGALLAFAPLAAADEAKTVRIMPIGDSITEGGGTFSVYRYPLWKKLGDAGYKFAFVGSRESKSPAGPLRHEGYGGKNAEFLATVLEKSLRDNPADVLLIHAGHNHFIEEAPVPGIVAATEAMIQIARAQNPQACVLLAQVITSGKLPKYSYIPALNEELAKLAARLHSKEQPVILVNQAEGFDWTTDTVADKVHPNEKGAEKMATRWFEALRKLLPAPKPEK